MEMAELLPPAAMAASPAIECHPKQAGTGGQEARGLTQVHTAVCPDVCLEP